MNFNFYKLATAATISLSLFHAKAALQVAQLPENSTELDVYG